jgi:hypothetical protein
MLLLSQQSADSVLNFYPSTPCLTAFTVSR